MNEQIKEKGSTYLHQKRQKELLLEGQRTFPELVFVPTTVGMFRDFETAERIVRVGIKGMLDVLVLGDGKYMYIDTKTGGAVLSKDQKNWREMLKIVNKKDVCSVYRDMPTILSEIKEFFYGN